MSEGFITWIIIAMLFGLFVALNIYFSRTFRQFPEKQTKVLDLRLKYNVQDVKNLFDSLGNEGRQKYKKTLWTLDLVYPVIYTALLTLIMGKLIHFYPEYKFFKYLPVIIMFFDYWENINTTFFINRYPNLPSKYIRIASTVTTLKWFFAAASISGIFFLLIKVLLNICCI